ncbi:thioredoxin domain-containing protein [Viridibacillus arvi]|uniref:thioredoxin domain-containing protein n=1 Tax=Viridibacillus arvi TaxID=263475 RepID=UPI003D0209A4
MINKKRLFKIIVLSLSITILFVVSGCNQNVNKDEKPPNLTEGLAFGNTSAPLKFVEYSSFQCPDCRKLHQNLKNTLQKYIDEQKIYYVFKPVDIKSFEYDQFIYNNLSENDENLNMINTIFEKQNEWSKVKTENEVKQILKLNEVDNSLSEKRKQTMNHINVDLQERGIREVPTFYINGERFVGVYSEEEILDLLKNEILDLLKK